MPLVTRAASETVDREPVTIEVGGQEYGGWESCSVEVTIEALARSWELSGSLGWPGEVSPVRVRPGAAAIVRAGGDRICTGYVDQVSVSDGDSVRVSISGRSRTQDLVDCSILGAGTWRGRTIEAIAREIADEYSLDVVVTRETGPPLVRVRADVGSTGFEILDRICRLRGLLVTDDEFGQVVITRAATSRADDRLVRGPGGNLLAGSSCEADASGVYSEYRCKGQRASSDQDFGEVAAHAVGSVEDDTLSRRRVLVVQPEGRADPSTCALRAGWEAATRLGKALKVSCAVQGWRQSSGRFWAPGEIVAVEHPVFGLDLDLVLVSATFSQGPDGTRTSLELAPVEGFEAWLPPEARRSTRPRATKAGLWAELDDVGKPAAGDSGVSPERAR